MIPYLVAPGSHLPLEAYSPEVFGSHFKRWMGSDRPSEHYIVFFYLSDIWALDRNNVAKRPGGLDGEFLLDRVEAFCGPDLAAGRCSVVLDMSAEGHPFYRPAFDELHAWCAAIGTSRTRLAIMSQNRTLARSYAEAFRASSSISFLIYDQFISGMAARLELDGEEFRSHFNFEKPTALSDRSTLETHPFLCLNATPRPIRICVLAALAECGILDRVLWSLLNAASGKQRTGMKDVEPLMRNLGLEAALPFVNQIMNGEPKFLDAISVNNSNFLIWNIPLSAYQRTFMSIVTETDFSGGDLVRITEKLVKSLVMGHPTIVFGNPGSLDLVRDLGFETFAPLIDEHYDSILDPKHRFLAVMEQIVVVDAILKQDQSRREKLVAIGRANIEHAFSGNFHRRYMRAVEYPLVRKMLDLIGSDRAFWNDNNE
jgi:hypothetical protein